MQKLVKVTFKEHLPMEMVEGFLQSDFVGLGTVYRRDDQRVLYVRPKPECQSLLIEQLSVWEREGMLSFVEETR